MTWNVAPESPVPQTQCASESQRTGNVGATTFSQLNVVGFIHPTFSTPKNRTGALRQRVTGNGTISFKIHLYHEKFTMNSGIFVENVTLRCISLDNTDPQRSIQLRSKHY